MRKLKVWRLMGKDYCAVPVDQNQIEKKDVVLTKWDDADKPILSVVQKMWRGHRGKKFQVWLKTGTSEVVGTDQLVSVV